MATEGWHAPIAGCAMLMITNKDEIVVQCFDGFLMVSCALISHGNMFLEIWRY